MNINKLMGYLLIHVVILMCTIVLTSCNPTRVEPPSVTPTEQEVKGISWVNYDREGLGGIKVSWEPVSSPPGERNFQARITASPPLSLSTGGSSSALVQHCGNCTIRNLSSPDSFNMGFDVSCGDPLHTITKVSFISGGTQ